MNQKPYIISISANSGGGKTTITGELCNRLSNARALYFDNYEFKKCPDNLCDWEENGSDPSEWDLTLLVDDIVKIIEGENAEYIILDYPFGRQDYPVKDFIDMTVFIDTPLDIALARRIMRDFKEASADAIIKDLDFYLTKTRRLFAKFIEDMKSSDLIVDGSLSVEEIVNSIMNEIKQRRVTCKENG